MPRKAESSDPLAQKIVSWLVVAVGTFMASMVSIGVDNIRRMGDSVNELNKNIAVIVERLATHDKKLNEHEIQIEQLKKEK